MRGGKQVNPLFRALPWTSLMKAGFPHDVPIATALTRLACEAEVSCHAAQLSSHIKSHQNAL